MVRPLRLSNLGRVLKQIRLVPVKSITFNFDPYHQHVRSIRESLFTLNSPKILDTNPECKMKFNVKSDGSEPVIDVKFDNGKQVLFKTENLTTFEIVKKLHEICDEISPPPPPSDDIPQLPPRKRWEYTDHIYTWKKRK